LAIGPTEAACFTPVPSRLKKENPMLKFNVPDMTCGHCAGAVTKAVKGVDADADVAVDLPSKTVIVETASDAEKVRQALEAAGYPATAG